MSKKTDVAFFFFCAIAIFLPFQFALNMAEGFDVAIIRILTIAVFVAVFAVFLAQKHLMVPFNLQSIAICAFFLLNAFFLFFADNIAFGARKIIFLASLMPIYFLTVWMLAGAPDKTKRFLLSLTIGGLWSFILAGLIFFGQFIFGIDGVLDFYKKIGPFFWGETFSASVFDYQSFLVNIGGDNFFRATGLFPDPHNFALFAGVISFLALAMFMWEKISAPKKVFYGGAFLTGIMGVILSFSRASYIALAIAFLALALIEKRIFAGRKVMVAGLILAIGVFVLSPAGGRFIDIFSAKDGSSAERILILKKGAEILRDNFIFGVGIGNAPVAFNKDIEYRNPTNSHNTYLEIFIESGILGFAIWLALIAGTIAQIFLFLKRKEGDARMRALGIGCFVALIYFGVFSFFEVFIYSPVNFTTLMILLGLCSVVLSSRHRVASQ